MQHDFIHRLQLVHGSGASGFMPVPGAVAFLARLSASTEWGSVVATGSWAISARFKLKAANLSVAGPIVSSDHDASREGIIRRAIDAALCFYRVEGFSRIVSIGDGIWDVNAARALNLPFVGIARGTKADQLKSFGVSHVLADFSDLDAVFTALDEAL